MGDLYNFCPVAGATSWRSAGRSPGPERRAAGLGARGSRSRRAAGWSRRRPRPDGELGLAPAVRWRTARVPDHDRATRPRTTACGSCSRSAPSARRGSRRRPVRGRPPAARRRPRRDRLGRAAGRDPAHARSGRARAGGAASPGAARVRGARRHDHGAELCLTLLRCVGVISQPDGAIATRPLWAGPQADAPRVSASAATC